MIIFYPRDIGLWRKTFSFDITIGENPDKPKRRYFYDRKELIEFLKQHGVILTDMNNPLEFHGPYEHHVFGQVYDVIQHTLIGWIVDDYV